MTQHLDTLRNYFKEKALTDIRFWIVLFFVLRLYGITDPPLEIAHNWRQATGNMVARNFYEIDNNILYPRLDIAGGQSGIIGTEFPTLNYLMYLLSLVFGFYDWFGRLIVLIVSSLGVLYFYKLLKLKFDESLSFYSAFILLTSMWLMYSRKVMPDTFSVSIVIIGFYFLFLFLFLEDSKWLHLFLYFFLVSIGVLSKIPAIYLLVILIFPMIDIGVTVKQKIGIILATVALLIPVTWWYFYWVPYLVIHYENWHYFMGTSLTNGFHEIQSNLGETAEKFYFESLKFIGFSVFIFGLIVATFKKEKRVLLVFLFCSLSFSVLILKSGHNFYHHSYYIIPFVPVMCIVAAYAITQIKKQWIQTLLLFAITAESIGNQQHDFRIKESEKYKLRMESIADLVTDRNDLFATNGGLNPQQLYFLHRRGWTANTNTFADTTYINYLAENRCKYVFINKNNGTPSQGVKGVGRIVYNDKDFVIYKFE